MTHDTASPRSHRGWIRWLILGLVILAGTLGILLTRASPELPPPRTSNYAISSQAPFNRPEHYPIRQTLPPDLYRPTGDWIGRLILPTVEEFQARSNGDLEDWSWFEVLHAPDPELQGQILRLEWGRGSLAQAYPAVVTTDVQLGEAAERSQRKGDVVPTRLDDLSQVGPLRSLAGARPTDDVIVSLSQAALQVDQDDQPVIRTTLEPLLVTGRSVTLVQILESVPRSRSGAQELCPTAPQCSSERFRVRHYDPQSGGFNGPEEILRIPQQPPDRNQVYPSTPTQIESSPAGDAGWYLYGAQDREGLFTVQALQPRSLVRLQPDQVILGTRAGLHHINQGNWQETPGRKGQVGSVVVDPEASTPEAAIARWQEGDYGLVMHLFGGIGGERAEPTLAGLVQGHFSFGLAQVIRDPFTDELIFEIFYQQVYAHNPHAIIAGTHTWADFTGNLQRGWLGSRPISDVIVKLDLFTQPYTFQTATGSSTTLEVLPELLAQLQVMMGRYRTGDGTGTATVTPATSCVQDSSQALYITIQAIRRQFDQIPDIEQWIQDHPDSPQLERMGRLGSLAQDLERRLVPYGVVRSDWRRNTEALAGINNRGHFTHDSSLLNALLSWRSMLPRRAQDELAQIFLDYGAQLWFLRTNQVGGEDPTILPLAPTTVFQRVPLLAPVLQRLASAMGTPLRSRGWTIVILAMASYGLVVLCLILTASPPDPRHTDPPIPRPLRRGCQIAAISLVQALLFRVALVPHPLEGASTLSLWLWGAISVVLFSLSSVWGSRLRSRTPYALGPAGLLLIPCLGLTCTLVYILTGSLLGTWILQGLGTSFVVLGASVFLRSTPRSIRVFPVGDTSPLDKSD